MSVPSMVHRSGDTLIVRSVVSGDALFGSEDDLGDEFSDLIVDEKNLPECKIKRNYSCSNCEYFTQNPRLYLYHLRDVHNEKVKIYECPNCLYASKHFQKLLRHTKMVHGSTEGVEMPENSRNKSRKRVPEEELDEQIDSDGDGEDENKNSFKCSMCTFSARNQGQLSKHEREEHIKAKYFKCGKCTYATNIKARFTKHTKYHSMPMIKCELCDFRTPYKWNLDRHCKNHNGSGAFKCSACNFTADIKQSLTVHEMNHHVPPVGQAAGLGVGRRRNKVGASDSALTEEAVQVVRSSAADTSALNEADESSGVVNSVSTNNNNNNNNNNRTNSEKRSISRKLPACKKFKPDQGSTAYGSDFIDPDDIIHHANGKIYIKNRCKLCNYKSAWDGEMARHEEKVHNIVRNNGITTKTTKKTPRPIPNLIPIPSQAALALKNPSRYYSPVVMMTAPPPAVSEPLYSQKDYNDICAKSANSDLKDLASLFDSEDMFKKPEKTETPKIPDLIPASISQKFSSDLKQKNASFFDKFKAKLATNKLTCELCGHKSKCLTESAAHQKTCGKEPTHIHYTTPIHTVSSTRCQYCRQRCKSSIDLLNHLQTCIEAFKAKNGSDIKKEIENHENLEPHPMENRVFVWNNIEVPLDVEMENLQDDSQYDYVEDTNKQDDNVSLDLSIRTHSPSSESSFVVNQEIHQNTTTSVTEKIPTHGNDISVAQHKRVFKCPHCTFWASTASRFHVHIVGHLNRKPFECSLCSYRSNWRWDITKHIKLKSVRDPNHESAKVLMTDETGRRNYTKYNKYLTEINVSGDHNETCGGFGTRTKNHDLPSQVLPNKSELPKLTRAPNSSDFRPLLRNQRPPPGLKAADESFFAKMANEKKRNNADSKKTMWKCKKCNFRDASREKLLLHVRDHYPPKGVTETVSSGSSHDIDEASLGGGLTRGQAPFQCGHCHQVSNWKHVIQRHCRLKHSGDIRVVIGAKSSFYKMDIDDQIEEHDHVDLPQTGTFKCQHCPFSNNNNEFFEQHLEGHSFNPDRTFKCRICVYSVFYREELVEHMKLHGISDPDDYLNRREKNSLDLEVVKRYRCTECPYVTNSKSQFAYHKQFHKPRRGEYTCSTCGYNVSKRHLLHQHLKVHGISVESQKQNGDVIDLEEASDEIEEVTNSGNTAVDSQNFSDIPLMWVSKNGKFSKMYKCRYCPHVNLRKINIQEHEKMHGTREKNQNSTRINDTEHKCPDCNYVCNNAGVLSSHSKVHQGLYGKIHGLVDLTKTDEEQIKELSQYAIYQPMESGNFDEEDEGDGSGDITQEPMETNSDAVVYFCDKCPARFLKENEFYIHLRFHGARLIYKCDYCSYTARQKPHVLAHKNVHTEQYQERTKMFKEMYCSHPDYPPPNIQATTNEENVVYVINENESKDFVLDSETEPESSIALNKILKSTFTVPLSGTELFQQRNQAQQNQRASDLENEPSFNTTASSSSSINAEPPFGGVMQGNPDFIYPTCIKNGRMKEKRYKCQKCPSAFEKRDQYKNHLNLHGAKQKYKCEYCDYSVKYYANYIQHSKKHKSSAEAIAAKKLPENTDIVKQNDEEEEEIEGDARNSPKRSNNTKESDDKKLFWCSICPYTNHRKDAVDNHQKRHKSISGSSSTYTCEHCDYTVPQSHFLRDHYKLHFGQNKLSQPEGYMICDNIKLTSKRADDNDEKSTMEEDVKTEENVIFEDKGCDDENRFDPPLKKEVLENLNDAGSEEKVFVNPTTGEHDKRKASTIFHFLDIVNRDENIDSHISSDN